MSEVDVFSALSGFEKRNCFHQAVCPVIAGEDLNWIYLAKLGIVDYQPEKYDECPFTCSC